MNASAALLAAVLLLAGCGSTPAPPPPLVVVEKCEPPAALMAPVPALPAITNPVISTRDMVRIWMGDIGAYNKLADRHAALILWITTYCQK